MKYHELNQGLGKILGLHRQKNVAPVKVAEDGPRILARSSLYVVADGRKTSSSQSRSRFKATEFPK